MCPHSPERPQWTHSQVHDCWFGVVWIPLKNIPHSLIVSFPKSKQGLQQKHISLLLFLRFSLFPPNGFQHLRGWFNGWIDNMALMDSWAYRSLSLKWEAVFIYLALGSLKDILFAWEVFCCSVFKLHCHVRHDMATSATVKASVSSDLNSEMENAQSTIWHLSESHYHKAGWRKRHIYAAWNI